MYALFASVSLRKKREKAVFVFKKVIEENTIWPGDVMMRGRWACEGKAVDSGIHERPVRCGYGCVYTLRILLSFASIDDVINHDPVLVLDSIPEEPIFLHRNHTQCLKCSSSDPEVGRVQLRRSDERPLARARRRTLRMTLTIVTVFACCWLPYATMTLCSNLMSKKQLGFTRGRSTIDAGVELVKKIFEAWEDLRNAIGVFYDFSKVFDCVNHETLIRKLHHYGVTGRALDLLASYLINRVQKVGMEMCMQAHDINTLTGVLYVPLFYDD
ncbi:hypothetical protein EVAR_45564_1 [Eumeta japonica]|uniref:Uncharacterized protein n=1 Tax=Eumeta variegata TaxID=151549 RepID=A0A4C1YWF4_EUMVA|nr:hypothetical protein EVAR_45564_1 [Eumeta japonica]